MSSKRKCRHLLKVKYIPLFAAQDVSKSENTNSFAIPEYYVVSKIFITIYFHAPARTTPHEISTVTHYSKPLETCISKEGADISRYRTGIPVSNAVNCF